MNQALAEVDDDFKKSYKMKIKELLDVKNKKDDRGLLSGLRSRTWNTRQYNYSFNLRSVE